MKGKRFWAFLGRIFGAMLKVFHSLHLILALLVGIAAAYLLGSVFGMAMPGYALGFVLGAGVVMGGVSFSD